MANNRCKLVNICKTKWILPYVDIYILFDCTYKPPVLISKNFKSLSENIRFKIFHSPNLRYVSCCHCVYFFVFCFLILLVLALPYKLSRLVFGTLSTQQEFLLLVFFSLIWIADSENMLFVEKKKAIKLLLNTLTYY